MAQIQGYWNFPLKYLQTEAFDDGRLLYWEYKTAETPLMFQVKVTFGIDYIIMVSPELKVQKSCTTLKDSFSQQLWNWFSLLQPIPDVPDQNLPTKTSC